MTASHETRQLNETSSFEFNGTESDATCDFCNFTIDASQKLGEDFNEEQSKEEMKRAEAALIYVIVVVAFYLIVLIVAVALSLRQQIQHIWFTFGSYHKRCDYSILDQFEDEPKNMSKSSKNFVYFDPRTQGRVSNI